MAEHAELPTLLLFPSSPLKQNNLEPPRPSPLGSAATSCGHPTSPLGRMPFPSTTSTASSRRLFLSRFDKVRRGRGAAANRGRAVRIPLDNRKLSGIFQSLLLVYSHAEEREARGVGERRREKKKERTERGFLFLRSPRGKRSRNDTRGPNHRHYRDLSFSG